MIDSAGIQYEKKISQFTKLIKNRIYKGNLEGPKWYRDPPDNFPGINFDENCLQDTVLCVRGHAHCRDAADSFGGRYRRDA